MVVDSVNQVVPESNQEGNKRRHHHGRSTPKKALIEPAGSEAQVLYIHPAKQGMEFRADEELGRPYGLIPLGLPAIINRLRQNNIRVEGVNYPLEKQLNNSFNLYNWLKARQSARVILIDMHWYEHCYGAIQTAHYCKQTLPGAFIIMGGLSASGFSHDILENYPEVDFIIHGDAETPLLSLVTLLLASAGSPDPQALAEVPNLSFRNGGIVDNAISYTACSEDLDSLDFADISFLEHAREYFVHEYIVTDITRARAHLQTSPYTGRWVCTARGCKYNCSYCGGSRTAHKLLANRTGLIVRSPEKVAAELQELHDNGVIQASFSWDLAELGEDYWQALFADLRRRNLKMGLYDEFFQLPTSEFIDAFAAHGDREHTCVALNPLAGNERVRRMNGKHYSNDALFEILDALSRNRMYIFVYFSINLPGETRQTFQETLELAQEIYDFYPPSLLKILNTTHTIDPLSPMNLNASKFGLTSHMTTFMDYYAYCRDTGKADPLARSGLNRGFEMHGRTTEDLEAMVNSWDRARAGRESSWWPVPLGW